MLLHRIKNRGEIYHLASLLLTSCFLMCMWVCVVRLIVSYVKVNKLRVAAVWLDDWQDLTYAAVSAGLQRTCSAA